MKINLLQRFHHPKCPPCLFFVYVPIVYRYIWYGLSTVVASSLQAKRAKLERSQMSCDGKQPVEVMA